MFKVAPIVIPPLLSQNRRDSFSFCLIRIGLEDSKDPYLPNLLCNPIDNIMKRLPGNNFFYNSWTTLQMITDKQQTN